MIVVGYQGIGKSSISKDGNGFIDLESGNFWVNGERDEKWYIPYCAIANHLSEQGYCVFVSSHEVVRKQLCESRQPKLIVCPAIKLQEDWIQRLQGRYEKTGLEKDFKALANAQDRYAANISELLAEDEFDKIVISNLPYDLADILEAYRYGWTGFQNASVIRSFGPEQWNNTEKEKTNE